ncbi:MULTISPECIES: PrsW family intramembrane metalloprotease [unclassified Crossiella]|uniref:PrsW family intramembrane metalloprotease n=1 Tax=unclassified Crossiella TaxID=2620835 RepID=UPI0020001D51|nr:MULTISPECIES: PrsW family intramembrane metalloprotease [unclassified Crossiella]MCK2239132.1 PrsW family intramembrane metalloprotease [Crossiella sp. S99.2]MCK2251299.1 PrsW family intramembrane metalloprotease [Crossiella sp. S99.1]
MKEGNAISALQARAFWQPRRAMLWVYLVIVVICLPLLALTFAPFAAASPVALGIALAGQLVLGVLLYTLIRWIDLFEKEPRTLLAAAFLWGVAMTALAGSPNGAIGQLVAKLGGHEFAVEWYAAIAGPTTEETLKALGVIAIVVIGREQVQRTLDGLVYGAMVGLGFQLAENVTYVLSNAIENPNSDVQGGIGVLLARFLTGLATHTVYSGVVGLGIGYALTRVDRSWARRVLVAFALFLGGWGLHFLWNSPLLGESGLVTIIVKQGLIVLFFILAIRYGARHEYRWFVSTLRAEPAEMISPAELGALRTRRSRRRARRHAAAQLGPPGPMLLRRLQDAQLALAVAKDWAADPATDPEVAATRQAIGRARAELARRGQEVSLGGR